MPVACLAMALLAPSTGRAGCDYPTHVQYMPPEDAKQAANFAPKGKPVSTPANKPCPCSGPTCSRSPLLPPTPFSVEAVKIHEWIRLPLPLFLAPPQHDGWLADHLSPRPIRYASTIYHPPRLS
jgi:hypothetical protein